MKLKNIGPCKFLKKFSTNAYEIELPSDLQISPIFNVSDLYPFRDAGIQPNGVTLDRDDPAIDWQGNIPQKGQPQIESILDKIFLRNIRNKTFFQYLVKWRNHPTKDATWMTEQEISKYNVLPEDLMEKYFLPQTYDAGESNSKFID